MGPLALGLSEVPAPNLSRMGLAVYQEIRMGENLLRSATRTQQVAPCGGTGSFLQVAADCLPLLERSRALRRGRLCPGSAKPGRAAGSLNPLERQRWFYQTGWI